jgi:hypothetical protein
MNSAAILTFRIFLFFPGQNLKENFKKSLESLETTFFYTCAPTNGNWIILFAKFRVKIVSEHQGNILDFINIFFGSFFSFGVKN